MNAVVRRILAGEGPRLRQIRLAALSSDPLAFASTHLREVDRPEEAWETWASAAASGPDQAVFVIEMAGDLVGLVAGYRDEREPDSYHLISMWVEPAHRRAGHGTTLVERLAQWAETSGGGRLNLWVVDTNSARGMYEACGFVANGATQPLAHDASLTEAAMSRPLRADDTHRGTGRVPNGYIEFAPMTSTEFDHYLAGLVEHYAGDLMQSDDLGSSDAAERAAAQIMYLLPNGEATPEQHLCTLRAGLEDTQAGWIWFGQRLDRDRPVTFLYDLEVAASLRRRGFGTAALAELEEWSLLQGHHAIVLHVFEHNTGAVRLYERVGFSAIRHDPGHIEMEKRLGPAS